MKPKLKITLGISILAILLFAAILFFQNKPFWNKQVEPSQQVLPQNYQALLPKKSDNPLGSGEEVSFEEAQRRISYPIPVPEAEKVKRVWISTNPENPSDQSVAIRFKRDLLLIIHKFESEKPPDWDKAIANEPLFKKIDVNGNSGMGADPGVKEFLGQPYSYPGSVGWWVNNLDITLYSDTMSLEELLQIAETVHPANDLPMPTETSTTDGLTPIPTELLIETPADLPTQTLLPEETITPTP